MNAIKGVVIEFNEQNPPEVIHGIQHSWREIKQFNLSSGFFCGIVHHYGDDSIIAGPLTYEQAKTTIISNLSIVPLGFTLNASSSWWSQYELNCEYCGGKGTGALVFILQKLIVYKAPPPNSIDLKILADGSPTYVFRVKGKLRCTKCQQIVEVNYPSHMQ